MTLYLGPVVCSWCLRKIRPAALGHEQDPESHGLHVECAPDYRKWAGLPPKQQEARG